MFIFALLLKRESSSAGRARPCQGRGRGSESRLSLNSLEAIETLFFEIMPRWWNW